MIIALSILLFIAAAHTHKVFESTEDIDPPETNITHLYPVHLNITNIRSINKNNDDNNLKEKTSCKNINRKATKEVNTTDRTINEGSNQTKEDKNKVNINNHEDIKSKFQDKTTWKIEAGFAETEYAEENDKVESENVTELFRPSQLLGYTVDEVTPRYVYEDLSSTVRMPASEYISSIYEEDQSAVNGRPKELEEYAPFPYKYERYSKPIGSWSPDTLDLRPTEEVPVKFPAGGLYQLPEVINGHSLISSGHEDYGYEIKEGVHDNLIKKRVNPWKNLLRVVTAIIPAGLLISALTPNIITVSPGANNYYPSKLRRSVTVGTDLGPISERCRRRLLCELQADTNYSHSGPARGQRRCYKIYCEDSEAVFKILRWLLSHHKPADNTERDLM